MTTININQKKQIILLILVCLLLVAGLVYWRWGANTQVGQKNPKDPLSSLVTIRKVEAGILPTGLPADLPVEQGAIILQNEILTPLEGGGEQSVRRYISYKSIEKNFDIFETYFKLHHWPTTSAVNEESLKSLSVGQADSGRRLLITISKNSVTSEVTVSLTSQTVPINPIEINQNASLEKK